MDELIAFWRARLDEAEAAAKAAGGGEWSADDGDLYEGTNLRTREQFGETWQPVSPDEYPPDSEKAAHSALHGPARELREVEVKRAVLRRCEAVMNELDQWPNGLVSPRALLARQIIVDHVAVYSNHPDYPQGWEPTGVAR